jgi:hypothetical protein
MFKISLWHPFVTISRGFFAAARPDTGWSKRKS